MDFLKKKRKLTLLTAEELGNKADLSGSSILAIEGDHIILGDKRAVKIAKALSIPEDVMTVYRGRLPKYAHKVYREKPDKLEKKIRSAVKKLEKKDDESM